FDAPVATKPQAFGFKRKSLHHTNLTAAAWNRNDEFLVQTKALVELLFENSVKTDPDVDLTPTKCSNHGSEPTIPEFDSQDTDGSINTLDTQSSVDTQDTQDELHVVTPDDMNTTGLARLK
ncbi:hypothetical protein JG688_00017389, partial [Phytophthora aleatoria]